MFSWQGFTLLGMCVSVEVLTHNEAVDSETIENLQGERQADRRNRDGILATDADNIERLAEAVARQRAC